MKRTHFYGKDLNVRKKGLNVFEVDRTEYYTAQLESASKTKNLNTDAQRENVLRSYQF